MYDWFVQMATHHPMAVLLFLALGICAVAIAYNEADNSSTYWDDDDY